MNNKDLQTMYWESGSLYLLDQRYLPHKIEFRRCETYAETAAAIKEMSVRGAPAIGISAAYGMAAAAREALDKGYDTAQLLAFMEEAAAVLVKARPTAVNLFWAVQRINKLLLELARSEPHLIYETVLGEAKIIHEEDIRNNRLIGHNGAALVPETASILTHCNAGALATGGYGTALGVIRAAVEEGKAVRVYVDETRPLLQGARITAFELYHENIPATLITDNSAAYLMSRKVIDLVVVGADRIAANGDVANKIGTYNLAVLASHHNIPFYIAAPLSTIDLAITSGDDIIIEERCCSEITHFSDSCIAPEGITVLNYAFDITPAELITAIITEKGVIHHPTKERLITVSG